MPAGGNINQPRCARHSSLALLPCSHLLARRVAPDSDMFVSATAWTEAASGLVHRVHGHPSIVFPPPPTLEGIPDGPTQRTLWNMYTPVGSAALARGARNSRSARDYRFESFNEITESVRMSCITPRERSVEGSWKVTGARGLQLFDRRPRGRGWLFPNASSFHSTASGRRRPGFARRRRRSHERHRQHLTTSRSCRRRRAHFSRTEYGQLADTPAFAAARLPSLAS